jgi:peptidase M28-like protein
MRRFSLAASLLFALPLLAPSSASVLAQGPAIDGRIESVLADVSPARLHEYLEVLTGMETRHSLTVNSEGASRSDWGVKAAREYILATMQGFSDRLEVTLDCYDVPAQGRIPERVELCNVMAVLPGRSERRVYVSGHYDTVARRAQDFDGGRFDNPAPGANDDGSGTVLTMEVARVMAQSGIDFDATLVFVTFVAEEEGLVGASLHSERALREGWTIDAVFNNDIIGNSTGGNGIVDSRTVRVFSEDPMDSPSRQLARFIRRHAAVYLPGHVVRLISREDRFGRGGDHTAFNRRGFAGVRMTESRENYSRQHMPADTLGGVDFDYLANNTRVNAAAVASIALGPAAPNVSGERGPMLGRGESGYAASMRWQPSAGASSYKVVYRAAWDPDWDAEIDVGNVTEYQIEGISIDDYVFGVMAVGPDGHESMVSAYVRAPRARSDIQEVGR